LDAQITITDVVSDYGQAIIKKTGDLGLNIIYRNGGVVAHIVQEIIGLALLPPNRIYEGFEVICR
jgi:hypothetical protein